MWFGCAGRDGERGVRIIARLCVCVCVCMCARMQCAMLCTWAGCGGACSFFHGSHDALLRTSSCGMGRLIGALQLLGEAPMEAACEERPGETPSPEESKLHWERMAKHPHLSCCSCVARIFGNKSAWPSKDLALSFLSLPAIFARQFTAAMVANAFLASL